MENKEHNDLPIKPRSYRAVVTSGFRFYALHFRALFRPSWQAVAVYALLMGLLGWVVAVRLPAVAVRLFSLLAVGGNGAVPVGSLQQYWTTLGMILLLALLCLLALMAALGCVTLRLKEHGGGQPVSMPARWWRPDLQLALRTFKGGFAMLLLLAVPMLLVGGVLLTLALKAPQTFGAHNVTWCCAAAVLLAVIAALALPLYPTLMNYLLDERELLAHSLRRFYPQALRRWGSLLAIFVVDAILAVVVDFIVCLPAKILTMANVSAQIGVLYGDPLGMPSHIGLLTFLAFALCAFFQFYATLPVWLHGYYAHGSIVAHEAEQRKQHEAQA